MLATVTYIKKGLQKVSYYKLVEWYYHSYRALVLKRV